MQKLNKYPTTPHIQGSLLSKGDTHVCLNKYFGRQDVEIVVSEKLDGANCGISFALPGDPSSLQVQSRSRWLQHKCPRQYLPLLLFSQQHCVDLCNKISTRYVIFFESMCACHSVFYDQLDEFFVETAILDTETGDFLSVDQRRDLLAGLPIVSAPVLARGQFASLDEIICLLAPSRYRSASALSTLEDVCCKQKVDFGETLHRIDKKNFAEGLYITVEAKGHVIDRCKYVRRDFENKMGDSNVRFIPNQLAGGR